MKSFGGKVLFLDRSDINTDEIIPAKYLTELTKEALKQYCLEDLHLDGFNPDTDLEDKSVIITRENFGCGSSREHAPWALEVNGINVVFAQNFARIFRQNMFNCGMMAIEMSKEQIDLLFANYAGSETEVSIDLDAKKMTIKNAEKSDTLEINVAGFDEALVRAGGWVEYADSNY